MLNNKFTSILFFLLLSSALFIRFIYLGSIPAGINQDEAFAGYEAWSMLNYGIDSWGYTNPIYFVSWGSGMNVFYSYLLRIFFYFLGAHTWVLRLPQAILGVISCYVFYRSLRLSYDKNTALLGLFIITIIPWHIIQSRWGLESSSCTFGLITGYYFFLKALKNVKYLYLAMMFYTIALYSYAVTWLFVFFTLLFFLGYIWIINKKDRIHILGALGLLFIFTMPLLLFILVNYGFIDEIKGKYFSIPRLIYWRSSEWGYNNLAIKLSALYNIFIKPINFFIFSYIPKFGLFYPFSLFFMIIGFRCLFKNLITDIKNRKTSYNLPMAIWLIIGILYGIGLYPSPTRLNFLYFALVWLIVLGIKCFYRKKIIFISILALYLTSFSYFLYEYFNNYNNLAQKEFSIGLEYALSYANASNEKNKSNIIITEGFFIYPKILWHQKIPVNEYIRTNTWRNFPQSYLESEGFLNYRFKDKLDIDDISTDNIYITNSSYRYFFYKFNLKQFGQYIVATPK